MPRYRLPIGLLILAGLTAVSGLLHGRLTHRWGLPPSMAAAAGRLQELPAALGNWKLQSSDSLNRAVVETLQCSGYVLRTYAHAETGDTIQLAVLLGPSGPISVHTPEVCYSSRDYTQQGERRKVQFETAGVQHTFWALNLRANDVEARTLQVYYGWSTGGAWQAPDSARLAFVGAPRLYKLQLAHYASNPQQRTAGDGVREFFQSFLPSLAACLELESDLRAR